MTQLMLHARDEVAQNREGSRRGWGWTSLLMAGALALAQTACATNAGEARAAGRQAAMFTGTWTMEVCDKMQPAGECGGFTVNLLQKGNRICGAHHAATPRLSRIDEGEGRSVVGTVVGNTAVLTIRSWRNGAIAMATLERQADGMHWVRTEKVLDGEGGDDLIALNTVLHRAKPVDVNQANHAAVVSQCKAYWGDAR